MNAEALNDCNKKHLAQLAKEKGITGWHAMRKDQLIRALAKSRSTAAGNRKKKKALKAAVASRRKKTAAAEATGRGKAPIAPTAPTQTLDHACQKDRIIVLTRDSYWLHAYWELSRTTLARARAALGQDWHAARPILRQTRWPETLPWKDRGPRIQRDRR